MNGGFWPALIISTLAGMSTAVGSLIALLAKRTNTRALSFALGFSAGVMVLVSFSELLPDARRHLDNCFSDNLSGVVAAAGIIVGFFISFIIDRLVPACENPHTPRMVEDMSSVPDKSQLMRMGVMTAIAITVHNFPEGIATFMAGYSNIRVGLPVALSIALHNIPEGIAVSIPVYYGTGSRRKAFVYSAMSGLSEPLGALLAFLVLAPLLSDVTLGIIFGAVAGIMIYISFDELIPASERYGRPGTALAGIISGLAVMWLALKAFGI